MKQDTAFRRNQIRTLTLNEQFAVSVLDVVYIISRNFMFVKSFLEIS